MAIREGCRHRDDVELRFRGGALRLQPAGLHRGGEKHVEIGLPEVGLGGVDELDHTFGDIAADHLMAAACEHGRRGKPDIAETNDANPAHANLHSSMASAMRRAAEPSP